MERSWSICFAVLLPLFVACCGSAGDSASPGTFDNTGGAPPPGGSIGFRSVSFSLNAACLSQLGSTNLSVLARAATDIAVINGNASCSDSLRTALADTFAALTADQALGIYNLNLGGCVRSYEVARVTRDGIVVRPWVLLHNTSLGALGASGPVVCTADAILNLAALVFDSAAGANAMELRIGTINSNYPRNPDVPRF
jgi:hypothetical protein